MDRYKGYIISPEAIKKLQALGITSRIEQAKKDGLIGEPHGAIFEDQVVRARKRLIDEGYYASLSEEDRSRFLKLSSELFRNRSRSSWKIDRNGVEEKEGVCLEDFLLLIGDSASEILKPEEFGDYNGFGSFSAWVGCVGALIENEGKTRLDKNYVWRSNLPNGRVIENSIGGSMHRDLHIKQTELTPYPTIDPFGNPTLYRPITRKDSRFMAPYHSTETSLLVAVLDYIDQRKVKSEIFEDRAQEMISTIRSGNNKAGNRAEAFSEPVDDAALHFTGYGIPIAEFIEGKLTHPSGHHLTVEGGEGAYIACITPEGNLGFYYRDAKTGNDSSVKVEFQASEIDHVIRGLAHQAANGLGRTNPHALANALAYRFSDNFGKKDY